MTLVVTDESKGTLKKMKNYVAKSELLLDQWLITKAIMMRNIYEKKINSNDNLTLKKMLKF